MAEPVLQRPVLLSDSSSSSSSVCDHWTQRKVTGKRKVTVDAEKSDGKAFEDGELSRS
jgi:hypothetical protein